ncbi:MAG TPA: hypothetical protein VLD67_06580, partial [Vicinamibacterales bacterium]|nr:hypothetical protein [Vicinamibacterales bacterium]
SRAERELWKAPDGPDPIANGKRAERLMDPSDDPMWTYVSRDGATLLYNNAVVGSRNLWLRPIDGSRPPRQVTTVSGDRVMHSSLSPDGSRVAFVSSANGQADVWVQRVDGSGLKQLTDDGVPNSWPVWSPDGRAIMYTAGREIRIIRADGGAPRTMMNGFFRGDWIDRPDGAGTWAISSIEGDRGIRLIDVEKGVELWREPYATGYSLPMFNRDGRAISFPFPDGPDRQDIAVLDTVTRRRRIAVRFPEPFEIMFRASWIHGDRAFAVNRVRSRSHIVLFDGLQPFARNP